MKEIVPVDVLCYHMPDGTAAKMVMDWGARLTAELNPIYAAEIAKLRAAGRRVVQIRNFAGDGGLIAVRHLFSLALNTAIEHGATDIIAACHPRSARGYRTFLFEDMLPDDPAREWDLAHDVHGTSLPTRLIRLAIDTIPPDTLAEWRKVESA